MKFSLELLAPAANSDIAMQAVMHGADAVYIGATSHGARKAASNSIADIEKVVDFAHRYRSKVYVTVNTLVFEEELKKVEGLCRDLYHVGVDALIVQDMSLLRLKLPPIALHASTQCDIRTPEKARFLEEVGFSQLVLARELTIEEIKNITREVKVPVEFFVHGALCVCYSGKCHASLAMCGRSANRGECAQVCRLPFNLVDSDGKYHEKNKYLLSLKDFNASQQLKSLIDAGVSSFKIEGRLKDMAYVKNITAFYNNQLNDIIKRENAGYTRSSYGEVSLSFVPNPGKSFNRGFTEYFLKERKPLKISSFLTPKSQGEKISNISQLNNGDGISFYDNKGVYTGVKVNKIENGRIFPAKKTEIPLNRPLYRTFDIKWERLMEGITAIRKIGLKVFLDFNGISAEDEIGNQIRLSFGVAPQLSKQNSDYRAVFEKLGNTPYQLREYHDNTNGSIFLPVSFLTQLRRKMIDSLLSANKINYPYLYRKKENLKVLYPNSKIEYRDNVSNSLAELFYRGHGVSAIERAAETSGILKRRDQVVMTTRHCILRETGQCLKNMHSDKKNLKLPLYLEYEKGRFKLDFDCSRCEMKVMTT
ncbi:MAG: U32 family peptidase [Muribaculaceae bacterium]|nr:U32 family peptidase [Muribaculaceae bacterium]